jgi:hypothetical protein
MLLRKVLLRRVLKRCWRMQASNSGTAEATTLLSIVEAEGDSDIHEDSSSPGDNGRSRPICK